MPKDTRVPWYAYLISGLLLVAALSGAVSLAIGALLMWVGFTVPVERVLDRNLDCDIYEVPPLSWAWRLFRLQEDDE